MRHGRNQRTSCEPNANGLKIGGFSAGLTPVTGSHPLAFLSYSYYSYTPNTNDCPPASQTAQQNPNSAGGFGGMAGLPGGGGSFGGGAGYGSGAEGAPHSAGDGSGAGGESGASGGFSFGLGNLLPPPGTVAQIMQPNTISKNPIRYFDGQPIVNSVDLSSDGFGKTWTVTRSYDDAGSNSRGAAVFFGNGR
jgi:hypothetical protein